VNAFAGWQLFLMNTWVQSSYCRKLNIFHGPISRLLVATARHLHSRLRIMCCAAKGLTSDRLGDAMTFFGLSSFEAHHLFCDCHYGGSTNPRIVARRVRDLAEHRSIFEVARAIWSRLVAA